MTLSHTPHSGTSRIDRGFCDHDDLTDGWRIPRPVYNEALDALEDEFGVDAGRDPIVDGSTDAESPPEELKVLDVTLNPEVAWWAAGAGTPDELDAEPDIETTTDDSAWLCPRCEAEIGVMRAAAIDAGRFFLRLFDTTLRRRLRPRLRTRSPRARSSAPPRTPSPYFRSTVRLSR